MTKKIEEIEIEDCDFSNPDHLTSAVELINAYILDEMGGGTPLSPIQQLRFVDGLNDHPKKIVLLASVEGKCAGMIVAFENFSTFTARPMVNIHDIIVKKEFRGNGIGRKMMEALENRANELRCSRITLEVREDNKVAQQLYKSMGFDETEPPMRYWRKYL
jgi:Acetyltransferases